MASSFWAFIGAIVIVAIICDTIVKLAKGGGKKNKALEADLAKLESDLDEALERIQVLEKIVTDGKHTLRLEIDDLAG